MLEKQHLIFSLHGTLYGISAEFVREICWLPELYSLATAPADILGIFNWRSRMVPVMHLDLRFGRTFSGCKVTDRAIVVEFQNTHVAIVAHEVYDVRSIYPVPLDLELIHNRQAAGDRNFIVGIAQSNDEPVTCLDLDRLIREPDAVAAIDGDSSLAGADSDFYSRCAPDASVADRATFASRAAQLKVSIDKSDTSSSEETGFLAVQIANQYVGLPIDRVIDVDGIERFSVSFVPGAPRHILGQINWRSEILPLLELGAALQLPALPRQEVLIVETNGLKMSIAVDAIFDVLYLNPSQIEELPLSASDRLRRYVNGVAKYQDSSMYLVNFDELVAREFLPSGTSYQPSAVSHQ